MARCTYIISALALRNSAVAVRLEEVEQKQQSGEDLQQSQL